MFGPQGNNLWAHVPLTPDHVYSAFSVYGIFLYFGCIHEPLQKGKTPNDGPCTNYFGSAYFYVEDIYYLLFYKTSYINEEVNRTEPPPSVTLPW
jgi:hypothetical protein